jgi:hypothetical protein
MSKHFSVDAAVKSGRAKTRDGRQVIGVEKARLNGHDVLVGLVLRGRTRIVSEWHIWGKSGLGAHGGDDLVNLEGPA